MKINLFIILLSFVHTINAQTAALDISVEFGRKSKSVNEWYIDSAAVIILKLKTDDKFEYRFSDISIQIVLESKRKFLKLINYRKQVSINPNWQYIDQEGYIKCGDCGSISLNNYKNIDNFYTYAKEPTIEVPVFEHECLSRLVIKVNEIKYKKNGQEYILSNFKYNIKYSFWASWRINKCMQWHKNNTKDFYQNSH